MKINKKIVFITFLLSILLLSNIIFATDPNDTNTKADTNNYIQTNSIDNNEDVYVQRVNTDNSLKSALSNVTTSENKFNEINLETRTYNLKNTLNTQSSNQLEKTIVINGNNSIIDGNNRREFAVIDKKITLILNNLTIRNMNFDIGGAISNSGTLIANNCNFENNTSTVEDLFGGGAIFNEGSMNITNSSFKNNYAFKSGSSIYTTGNLNNQTYINIDNCIFENNIANKESTFHTLGSTVVNIVNSTFNNNTSLTGSTIVNQNSNLTITNTKIFNEKTSNILNNQKNLIIDNLSICQNEIENSIIYNDYNLLLKNSRIYNNNATSIIENKHYACIYNSTINDNSVNNALIYNIFNNNTNTTLRIDQSIISNNNLNTSGVLNDLDSISIINSTLFQNNTSRNNDGIIEDYYGNTYIYDSEFINNTSSDLFKGNLENFIEVSNNNYLGNNLNTKLNIDYSSNNDFLIINGTIQTDKIYNTSVNLGYFTLIQDECQLCNTVCNGTEFEIESSFDKNSNQTLTVLYNGESHFRNQQQELIISINCDDYEINITNLVDNYMYGDNIHYDIIIKNHGLNPAENIQLQYLIPDKLSLINSSYYINEENICNIPHLNVNETLNISINCTVNEFKNLKLEFNIYDIKQNTFMVYEKNITYTPPFIELNNLNARIGDMLNITANIHNYKKNSMDNITFKFQYKTVNANILFENNTITIINYKIKDNLVNKAYVIELICNDSLLETSFSNTSKIYLSKLDTYSKINYNSSNNYINLSATFYDENDCLISNGSVILKIDGISIKTFKLNDSILQISNLRIDKKNQLNNSEILIIYIGNNKYNGNRNTTYIHLNKKVIELNVSYELENDEITIYAQLDGFDNEIVDKGSVSFKINGKSMTEKINITNNNLVVKFNISSLYNLSNLSMSYYGTAAYLENSLIIPIRKK